MIKRNEETGSNSEAKRGREEEEGGKRRSSVLVAFLLQLLPLPPICTSIPLLLSLLSLSIYVCIITMLPSLISPETAKFSAEEAPSHTQSSEHACVCVSVCREIKRVPRKAGVQLQPSNKDGSGGSSARPRADLLHNDGAFAEKQGRNCNFLTEETT